MEKNTPLYISREPTKKKAKSSEFGSETNSKSDLKNHPEYVSIDSQEGLSTDCMTHNSRIADVDNRGGPVDRLSHSCRHASMAVNSLYNSTLYICVSKYQLSTTFRVANNDSLLQFFTTAAAFNLG